MAGTFWGVYDSDMKIKSSSFGPNMSRHSQGVPSDDCESFARRTFATPKIQTFTYPKFGHLPPPQTVHLPGGQLPTPFFFFFFWRTFLGFFDLQLMEDIKDGKEEVLDEVVMDSSRINRFTHGLPPEYKSLLFKWVKNLTIKNERLFKLGKIENPRCDF